MKKFEWTIAVVIALSFFPAIVAAEYRPGPEFIAIMQERLKSASFLTIGGPFFWKEVQAGVPSREGDVAYYGVALDAVNPASSGSYLQLEEWRSQTNGRLVVTYTVIKDDRVETWSWISGTTSFTKTERLDLTSPEVRADIIEKSRRAQELLLKYGLPVVLGGKDI